jgi:glycosyltransferase involved in cell wall biosynthesis
MKNEFFSRAQPAAGFQSGVPIQPTIYFDVSDLLLYLQDHTTLSGIQRVQCEIIRNLVDIAKPQRISFVVLDVVGGAVVIKTSALLEIIEYARSNAATRAMLGSKLSALVRRAAPAFIRPHEIYLTVGAFWGVSGAGILLQELKNSGVIIGVFIHDIITVTNPEYFAAGDARVFVKGFVEALTFADFILTTSEYNRTSLIGHMAARNLQPLPVRVVLLGHELSVSAAKSQTSSVVADVANSEFVLCVGTIEVRKNPTYLFNIWQLMIRSGRASIPTLVLVGRNGWLVQDLMEQLKASNYLDGKIAVLHGVTDAELALLYQNCLLTMFPSWAEGWGLPVGESLAHGKISIAAKTGAIPEVAGELVDYVDPYNARDGLEKLLRYLDDPQLRRSREREIARHFNPRSWRKVADDFLHSAQALAREARPFEGVAAIKLPPNRYLPISSDARAIALDGMEGELSADLICISGWRPPEIWGVWADDPLTILRFRTDAPIGTRIHLVLRLIAPSSEFPRIQISSGSGAKAEVSLAGRVDRLLVLSCEVEPGHLVYARLSMASAGPGGGEDTGAPYWGLKGILYFQPESLAGDAPKLWVDNRSPQHPSGPPLTPSTPVEFVNRPECFTNSDRVVLVPATPLDENYHAASFGAFLNSSDCYWRSRFRDHRDAPIFADHTDKQLFYDAQGAMVGAVTDQIKLIRRRDQYVSTSRFTEGSVFDRSGVSRGWGYLQKPSPPAAWLLREADRISTSEKYLAVAPCYEKSSFIFYNGNLHNYYHWMTEGILSLHILSRAIAPDPNLTIILPKSMDVNAVFDHRDSLRAVGLDGYNIVEVGETLIKVREAIWVDSDLVQLMPAPNLRDFQQRVAARYAGARSIKKRRLLIARRGPTRKIHNIEQVQKFLANYNFETIYLEGMKVADQILLFQSAEFVISPHGAGLANLLFCEPGTKVIEFMPAVEMRPFFWLISEKLDLVHGVQFCAPAEGQGFQAAVDVDIGKLEALYRMVDAHY